MITIIFLHAMATIIGLLVVTSVVFAALLVREYPAETIGGAILLAFSYWVGGNIIGLF